MCMREPVVPASTISAYCTSGKDGSCKRRFCSGLGLTRVRVDRGTSGVTGGVGGSSTTSGL